MKTLEEQVIALGGNFICDDSEGLPIFAQASANKHALADLGLVYGRWVNDESRYVWGWRQIF
jgi:hypothetical protein